MLASSCAISGLASSVSGNYVCQCKVILMHAFHYPPQAAGLVSGLMESWPPMKALVLVLKVFLQQRELNEVYSGGVGSYALLTMVAAFLQLHSSRLPPSGSAAAAAAAGAHRRTIHHTMYAFATIFSCHPYVPYRPVR